METNCFYFSLTVKCIYLINFLLTLWSLRLLYGAAVLVLRKCIWPSTSVCDFRRLFCHSCLPWTPIDRCTLQEKTDTLHKGYGCETLALLNDTLYLTCPMYSTDTPSGWTSVGFLAKRKLLFNFFWLSFGLFL